MSEPPLEKKESSFFEKKEAKKLLFPAPAPH
jgi:hypothetical protein